MPVGPTGTSTATDRQATFTGAAAGRNIGRAGAVAALAAMGAAFLVV